jgi:hypothetical protein
MSYITLQPAAPASAFGVAYTADWISFPYHRISMAELSTVFPVLETWGCTKKQLRLLTYMIQHGMEGHILEEGTVDLRFELEGEDLEEEERLRSYQEVDEAEAAGAAGAAGFPPMPADYASDGEDEGEA